MRKLTALGVTMETSKVTSKTSSLKALLLRAWRERWSDLQWGIHIKTILPRGVSGDVYNLADCILQQALVGPGPNQLVLSYLKHSLSSQLVSYAAVLLRISKYEGFHKPHCIISLLEFLENILSGVTCRGKPEEGVLAGAILSLVHWLLQCYYHGLTNNTDYSSQLMEKPAAILHQMLMCDFTTAMLYLAKHEDKELYAEVVKKCREIEVTLNQNAKPVQESIQDSLTKLCSLELGTNGLVNLEREADTSEPLTYVLQALLAVEVLLNPSADTNTLVNKLLMVQRLKGYSNVRLYCELIRGCLMSLNDVLESSEESQWGAFTFLKLPHVLHQLHSNTARGTGEEFSQDIADALELLLQFTPLLDVMDARCACNTLECLLNELIKLNLLTEMHIKHYIMKREGATVNLHKTEPSQTASIPKVIIKAEPTLARLLKTLDADYGKIQEALLSMLCQVLSGKSFELILAVATVEGKLRTFVTKLIKFNECSKQAVGDSGRASQTRAMLFDVTFLMLCSIVQTYGSEVVLCDEEQGDSFFAQWVRECIVERGKPKSPDNMLQHCDPVKIDTLLSQFNSSDSEFKNSQMKWHEVCVNVPGAIKEVLVAWEYGALSPTDVKRILDAMRARMCCLPVCAAAWLCSYMQVLHQDALLKPMNMVQQFLTTPTNEEMAQQDNFKERSGLMFQIIRKMQYDVHPPTLSKIKVMTLSHSIISKQPISEQLDIVWSGIQQRGWLNIEATHLLESLLNTGGAQWFVRNLVKEVLKFRYRDDLDRAVDLVFSIFHLDIENCTMALLLQVLPQYLHNKLQSIDLVEPQSSAVAKLCAYCVFAASQAQTNSQKHATREVEFAEDLEDYCPANKLMRLDQSTAAAATDTSLVFLGLGSGSTTTTSLQEPLLSALKSVFKALSVIAEHPSQISQPTHFVFRFLEYVVRCGKDRARSVLQDIPNTLVPCLVRALPDLFTTDLILRLYDLDTIQGRKATARDLCLLRNMSMKQYMS
ncbi:mediator complex subunit 24 isoform X2 [Lycorma delicatula]|uniref:mediator complex subunit 24 isoform X2 n=1 Tax=Lycorma delicatula TaxID=130591 RepID=UPI003F5179EC